MSRDVPRHPTASPTNDAGHQPGQPSEHHPKPAPRLGHWLTLALLLIVLDQVTKLYFDSAYTYGQRVNVLPIFDFTLMYNRGAAFSFLASEGGWQRWFFTVLGIVAAIVIVWMLRRHTAQPRFSLALTLILSGALGNVIDRVAYGHVIDFLLFYWKDWYYPAFNVADICITCGAVLLVLDEVLRARKSRR
ncbi:signal peptidase II [Bordetella tumulicola]|uniref:signal peptidase II n=1 Tax=Bordetella tumulicola TaxID=1649133 RepID=UPI0039EE32BC